MVSALVLDLHLCSAKTNHSKHGATHLCQVQPCKVKNFFTQKPEYAHAVLTQSLAGFASRKKVWDERRPAVGPILRSGVGCTSGEFHKSVLCMHSMVKDQRQHVGKIGLCKPAREERKVQQHTSLRSITIGRQHELNIVFLLTDLRWNLGLGPTAEWRHQHSIETKTSLSRIQFKFGLQES